MRTDAAVLKKFKDPDWDAGKLGETAIFRRFNALELKNLYSCGRFAVLRPQSHAVIDGEPTRGLFVILDGTVNVYKTDPTNNSLARLAVLDADDFNKFLGTVGENLQLRFYRTCAEELVDRLRKLNTDHITSQNMLRRYAFRHKD